MTTFNLPDLGEGLQDAEVVTWHVGVGDHVVADQPLVSVETAKAVVEIPSPQAGRIAKIFADVGDVVAIGAPLVAFEMSMTGDAGTVVGEVPETQEPLAQAPSEKHAARPGIKASPAVRKRARELGVDLALVSASGSGGTITKADVERVSEALAKGKPLEPLRGVRLAMAQAMAKARAEVVPTTVTDVADLDAWAPDSDITMRLIRAIVAACQAEPSLNAWYFSRDQARQLHDRVDLGIAMDTDDGLFVPVLRDVGARDRADLRRGLEAMKADVRNRTVPLEELRGQTITLSNFGMFGGQHAALMVMPPQVAILGAGRIQDRVIAVRGKATVRRTLPLSLTFDHRPVTGGEASRFLAAVIADMEKAE